jgi:hypothetical protein
MNAPLVMPRAVPALGQRLLALLPAIYAQADRVGSGGSGDLQHLLAAFETVLFGPLAEGHAAGVEQGHAKDFEHRLPTGLEQRIEPGLEQRVAPDFEQRMAPGFEQRMALGFEQRMALLPTLLAAGAAHAALAIEPGVRAAFAHWLAARWVGFTPHAHFDAPTLERIVAGIVPMYGRRGTAGFLVGLLHLAFDEIARVRVHEHAGGGLRLGEAIVGESTRLTRPLDFCFGVRIALHPRAADRDRSALAALAACVRAVVDFAKPAHTRYDLEIDAGAAPHHPPEPEPHA